MIDRVFTKAEARHIPNGPDSTADMAHPTRTGDLIAFAYPPYQFDASTPGTLISPSHFFGQHGYVPDVKNLPANVNMRATFLAGGNGIGKGAFTARSIDLAPTLAFMLDIPEPQHSQGKVLLRVVRGGSAYKPVSIIGLNDFHGQLDPTTRPYDNAINAQVGGACVPRHRGSTRSLASLPGPGLILAGGDNVGASPPNSALLEDMPAIDVENAWGLDATSYGNHEFDYGVERLLAQQARANFPFLATNIVDEDTGKAPDWVTPSKVFKVNGVRVGVIGAGLEETPELVSAGATAGPGVPRRGSADRGGVSSAGAARRQGADRGHPRGHRRSAATRPATHPACRWEGPILTIADQLQSTTVDSMIVGHTHRVSNLQYGDILITEGINAGASYSVLQLMVKGGDVAWAGGATRVAKDDRDDGRRPDVQAIIDAANAETAELRNQVIGTQAVDILRDPTRLQRVGDGQPRRGLDVGQVPGCRRCVHQLRWSSRRPRVQPAERGRGGRARSPGARCSPCCRSATAASIMTLTGADLEQAFLNGFSPVCNPAIHSGRFPQTGRAEGDVPLRGHDA